MPFARLLSSGGDGSSVVVVVSPHPTLRFNSLNFWLQLRIQYSNQVPYLNSAQVFRDATKI